MKPLGYFRALEKFMTLIRDNDPDAMDEAKQKAMDDAAEATDQAWADLSKEDQLMVFNMARHLSDNIKPAKPEPEKPLIQLLH